MDDCSESEYILIYNGDDEQDTSFNPILTEEANYVVPEKNESILKKMYSIIYLQYYCGLCFDIVDDQCSVNQNLEIVMNEGIINITMREMLSDIFNGTKYVPASEYICKKCSDTVTASYIFIYRTKESAKLVNNYVNSFYFKTQQLFDQLDPTGDYKDTNFILVLENEKSEECFKEAKKEINDNSINTGDRNTLELKSSRGNMKIQLGRLITLDSTDNRKRKLTANNSDHNVNNATKYTKHSLEHTQSNETDELKKTTPQKCEICFKTLSGLKQLLVHYKVHNKIRCKICHVLMPDTDLQLHLKLNHNDDIHLCEYCEQVFYTECALGTHIMATHVCVKSEVTNEDSRCVMCLKFCSKNQLNNHPCRFKCLDCIEVPCIHHSYLISYRDQILNNSSQVKCLKCDYVCRGKENLIGHVNREHLNHHPHQCDICGTEYYSKLSLKAHSSIAHGDSFVCDYCDQSFRDKPLFENHVLVCQTFRREFECEFCEASFDRTDMLNAHMDRKHNLDFPCDLCKKTFKTEVKLREHKAWFHQTQKVKMQQSNRCPICNIKFSTKGEYMKHMQEHGVKFSCKICNKDFDGLRKLMWHNRIHKQENEKRIKCKHCDKEVIESQLHKHMKLHEGNQYVCETCGKSVVSRSQLDQHKRVHCERKPCKVCGKLIRPISMYSHLRCHKAKENPALKRVTNPNRPRPHKCEYCDYATFTRQLLESHVNRYHLKIKPHVCDVCGAAYSCKYQMNEHKIAHAKDKWYPCPLCDKTLRHKSGLRKHMMLHTGERPHICELCGEGFITINAMKEHRQKHDGKKAQCPLCSLMFYTVKDMRQHIKRHHWKFRDKPFDYKQLGLNKEHYYIFKDGRKANVDDDDVEFAE